MGRAPGDLLDGVDADLFERRGPLWSDPLDPVQVVFHASHSSAPAFLLLGRVAPAADSTRLAVSAHPTRRGSRVRPPDHRWIDGGNGHNGLHFSSEVGSAAGILGPASDHVVMAAKGARRESQYSSRCHDNSSSTAGRPNGSPAWQTHHGPGTAPRAPLSSEDGTRTGRPGAVCCIRHVTTFSVAIRPPPPRLLAGRSAPFAGWKAYRATGARSLRL